MPYRAWVSAVSLREFDHFRHRCLHAKREFIRFDAGRQRRIVRIFDAAQPVEPTDQIEADRLRFARRRPLRLANNRVDWPGSMRSGTASCAGPR